MFLTSVQLNPARRETRKLLASPQAMHAAVQLGFPPGPDATTGRVLWRLDRASTHELTLWVSSPSRPDYRGLVEHASWPEASTAWRTADTTPFLGRVAEGQQWRFRVTVNPTRSVAHAAHSRGRVTAVRDPVEWFLDRARRHGFSVPDNTLGLPNLAATRQQTLRFERRTDGQRRTVTLVTATFDGVLQVEDPGELVAVLTRGLGRAKGYGCGLMTLAPAG